MTNKRHHENYAALLPAYLNGTLSQQEHQEIENALQDNTALQHELAMWQAVQQIVVVDEASYSPGEMGLKRLQKAIAEEKSSRVSYKAANDNARFWRPIAIAACLMVVLQLGVLLMQRPTDTHYIAAGESQSEIQEETVIVRVTFAPEAAEADLRTLLRTLKLEIDGGPSALGMYQLRMVDSEADLTTVLDQLRASPLVDSAQSE